MPMLYLHSRHFNYEFHSQIELDDLEDCNCHGISHINCFQTELLETDLDSSNSVAANFETVDKIPIGIKQLTKLWKDVDQLQLHFISVGRCDAKF